MPFGQTAMTLMLAGSLAPTFFRWPSRKPCDRPSVAPGRRLSNTRGKSSPWAASEISSRTMSDSLMTANISPSVPFASVKPALRASSIEPEPARRPILTLMPVPSSESRRFWACAGPCEPQPITPICLTPAKALGSSGNRWRPPLTICSVRSLILTVSTLNSLDEKLMGSSVVVLTKRPSV